MRSADKQLNVRLTEAEVADLKTKAAGLGLSVAEYLRRLTSGPVTDARLNAPAPALAVTHTLVASSPCSGEVIRTAPMPYSSFSKTFAWPWEAEADAYIQAGMHVFVTGRTAVGKSVWAQALAKKLSKTYYMATMSFGIDRDTLEGRMLPFNSPNGIELRCVDGIIPSAIAAGAEGNGSLLLLEEGTRMPGDLTGRFLTACNKHGVFDVTYRGGSVALTDGFQTIVTANPATAEYRTDKVDAAFGRRFMKVEITDPDASTLLNYLVAIKCPQELRRPLALLMEQSYQKFNAGEWDSHISPGHASMFVTAMAKGVPERLAFYGAIANHFEGKGTTGQSVADTRKALWDNFEMRKKGTVKP